MHGTPWAYPCPWCRLYCHSWCHGRLLHSRFLHRPSLPAWLHRLPRRLLLSPLGDRREDPEWGHAGGFLWSRTCASQEEDGLSCGGLIEMPVSIMPKHHDMALWIRYLRRRIYVSTRFVPWYRTSVLSTLYVVVRFDSRTIRCSIRYSMHMIE